MKAIVKETNGKGACLKDYPMPTLRDNEVLIKVKAAAICGTDLHIYDWNNWAQNAGINIPTVMGHECCGEVVEVGKAVRHLRVGDYVACETHIPCGECYQCKNGMQHICSELILYGIHTDGCFAEYSKIPEICAIKIPRSIEPKIGAVLEPLGVAVRACMEGEVGGKNIAIIGCGPIGLMAINVAKAFGAANIIAMDINDTRLDMAKELGATLVINSSETDTIKPILELTKGVGTDVFIDASGNNQAILNGFKSMRKGGTSVLVGLPSQAIELDLGSQVVFKEARIIGVHGRKMFETWTVVSNLLDKKLINIDPIITHVLDMKDFEKGFDISQKGNGGKIILIP